MYFSGVNYLIHYRIFVKGDFDILKKDREFLFYTGTCIVSILFVTGMLYGTGLPDAQETYLHYRNDKMPETAFYTHVAAESNRVVTLYGAFSVLIALRPDIWRK
ncbi:hypothetical protein JXA80_09230 [bacterium]|nr:hypothetical protein [candidate division CSSED10-310 bacterium]